MLHYDGLASHAFLMQIYGRKKFILYGPDHEPYMYPRPGQINASRQGYRMPKLETISLCESGADDIHPWSGETLFIQADGAHDQNVNPSISISVNT